MRCVCFGDFHECNGRDVDFRQQANHVGHVVKPNAVHKQLQCVAGKNLSFEESCHIEAASSSRQERRRRPRRCKLCAQAPNQKSGTLVRCCRCFWCSRNVAYRFFPVPKIGTFNRLKKHRTFLTATSMEVIDLITYISSKYEIISLYYLISTQRSAHSYGPTHGSCANCRYELHAVDQVGRPRQAVHCISRAASTALPTVRT